MTTLQTTPKALTADNEGTMAERDRSRGAEPSADEGFLRRWSRRKAEAQGTATAPPEDPGDPSGEAPAGLEQVAEPAEPASIDPKDLPAIDTLDATSDFTVFMRPGVPLELRNQALRKLWRSDPVLANLDGLLEYGEDYSLPSWPKEAIRTAYKVGRGFVEQISEAAEPPDQVRPTELAGAPADEPKRIPAETLVDEATLKAVPSEPSPIQPPAPAEPGAPADPPAPQEAAARIAIKRRRLPQRS
jgi:hypothetical protein